MTYYAVNERYLIIVKGDSERDAFIKANELVNEMKALTINDEPEFTDNQLPDIDKFSFYVCGKDEEIMLYTDGSVKLINSDGSSINTEPYTIVTGIIGCNDDAFINSYVQHRYGVTND